MFQKKDWKMTFALILLIVLLGGYYDKLGVEARTMVLPLAIFIAAGISALGVAIITVSWQSWKAATRNPVQALRYE